MRILFNGTGHPQNIAKAIKRSLSGHGVEIGLRRCEEIFARMTGYVNWHELRTVAAQTDVMSPRDAEAGPEVAAARHEQFVTELAAHAGLDRKVAEAVMDGIQPTGRRIRAPMDANNEIPEPPRPGQTWI